MTAEPHTNSSGESISSPIERVLHDFVRDAVSRLLEVTKGFEAEFEDDYRWERGGDGHFRKRRRRMRTSWPMLIDDWLRSLPSYQTCVERLKSDPVVSPHLDCLVGHGMSARRLETDDILKSLVYGMLDDEGRIAFSDERFQSKWRELTDLFVANCLPCKMVAPLPYLVAHALPLQLNDELVLDSFTEDEVTRCHQVGVVRPVSERFPLIYGEIAVGIRKTSFLPKLIQRDRAQPVSSDNGDEGRFGNRPLFRDDLVVDDVLSALRLFKHCRIRAAGLARWTDSYWLKDGTSFRILGQWPYGGKAELSEDEVPNFLELWRLLEEGAGRFAFSVHRFNLAFDRGLLADRIVDLVIAAEALFLGDLDEKYRGELRFRFALRAAKFIEHPSYGEHDIFRLMRQAYDVRSAIVHGRSPSETRLPDNPAANLPTFIEAIEELVRLGLRKALSMREDGRKLRQSEYWDTLIFSRSGPG